MIKNFYIVLFLVIASCQGDKIPDEIEISNESQKLGEQICQCYNKSEESKEICILDFEYLILKRIKKFNDQEKDQFLKKIYHALIETECADSILDDINLNEF